MRFLLKVVFLSLLFTQAFLCNGLLKINSLEDSLIAFYSFDGNAKDLSKNANDGFVFGATLTEDRFGNENSAYYFDGMDDFIVIPDSDVLTPTENNLSISVWAKVYPKYNSYILYKGSHQYNREYAMGMRTDSLASFQINDLGSGGENQWGVPSKTKFGEPKWSHIVGVYDGWSCKIYVNGKLENTTYRESEIGNYDSDLYIGTYGGDLSKYAINAAIDDIRIYNRVLTESEINYLFTTNLNADFVADKTEGNVPLEVHFTDTSTTNDTLNSIQSWQWDFENDGVVDSEEKNPTWSYNKAGSYSVKLIVSDSTSQSSTIKENYITVFDKKPTIISISDVPQDQGGWVKVDFVRSIYDTDSLHHSNLASSELYTIEINDGSGWISSNSLVAYGKNTYSVLAHTTKDLRLNGEGLISFRVIAGMNEGNFASDVMVGFSLDNLRPFFPRNILATISNDFQIQLSWDENTESDFQNYLIYRSNDYINYEIIGESVEPNFIDGDVQNDRDYYYKITAVDINQNESEFSETVSILFTDNGDNLSEPISFSLSQNFPNPFNPSTVIKYSIPQNTEYNSAPQTTLKIYDILGREVATLVNNQQKSGNYEVNFNAKDLSSGIYYYRLKSGSFSESKKMILLK